jgi:hypothetical protein
VTQGWKVVEPISRKGIVVSGDAAMRLQITRAWLEAYPSDAEVVVLAHLAEAASDSQLTIDGQ